jgi:16S rRNA (guanine527-N7)-methyltransferase
VTERETPNHGRAAPRERLVFPTDAAPLAPPAGWLDRAREIGVELEPGEAEQLGRYLAILLASNEVLNLTAITDPAEAWTRHILDALTLMPLLAEAPENGTVADVGSGGGVPAIPLAIVLPRLRFTLIESTAKKAAFLEATIAALGLANATVNSDRAEEIAQDRRGLRESFDVVTARALGRMNVAAELCIPLCRVGGRVVFVKGQKADEELEEARPALEILGGAHAGTLDTPTGRLVVIEKASRTPRTYPRAAGEPKRKPLS